MRPLSEGLVVQPAPSPWSARQAQMWSMIVLLLFTISAALALAAPAPPTRRDTSEIRFGAGAWLAEAPFGPSCSSAGEFGGPASKSRLANLTPSTSPMAIG